MARSPGMRGIFLLNEEAKTPKILKITGYGCTKVGDNDAYANRHHPLSPSRLPQLPSASRFLASKMMFVASCDDTREVCVCEEMDVSENSGFSPQIIHFNRVFHYKPSILGYPYFRKHLNRDDEVMMYFSLHSPKKI